MKKTFTVRLPVKAPRGVRRSIPKRAQVDGRVVDFLVEGLAESGRQVDDPDLLGFAISLLEQYAARGNAGDEWVSDHITAVYRALQEYRGVLRAIARDEREPTRERVKAGVERARRDIHAYALIDRKTAFGVEWATIETALLELIANGEGAVSLTVRGIGELEVRGAGARDLGQDAAVVRVHLEARGDRRYLTATVTHKVDGEPVRQNHGYTDVLRVAITQATIVADDHGVSLTQMHDEARSIKPLVAKTRRWKADSARHARLARKMMDARNNYFRQYAVRASRYAAEHNLAVEIAFHEGNTRGNPKILGMNTRLRRMLVDEMFRQCRLRGVVFIFGRTDKQVDFRWCAHRREVALGALVGDTVHGMCESCASKYVVD